MPGRINAAASGSPFSTKQHVLCFTCVCWQVDTKRLPLNITPLSVAVCAKHDELRVVWPGDPPHVSLYSAKWLHDNAYWTATATEVTAAVTDVALDKSTRRLFDAKTFTQPDGKLALPRFCYQDVMTSSATLYSALAAVGAVCISSPD